jgi:trans-aconitate methyltransferase
MSSSTSWNPKSYAKNARFVSDLGEPLLQLLEPKSGELILDLGCGDGALTEKLSSFGCPVVGVDASFAQIQAAKTRGVNGLVMDGRQLCFKQCFDAVFTNAALHWMKQPEKVVIGMWNCLKPGGRFVGEFGGQGNVDTIRSALHEALRKRGIDPEAVGPWYYPSPVEYAKLLAQAGFTVTHKELIPRPTKLPGDILGWLEVFAQAFTRSLPEGDRASFLDEVRDELEPALRDGSGRWFADYVRLRFTARK